MSQALAQEPDAPRESQLRATPPRESHVAATRPPRMQIEAFGNTDIGLVREGNEDTFAVLPHLGLFMVADGMGGAAAGEVASRMAIDCVREAFENPDMTWPAAVGPRPACRPDGAVMLAGIQHAHTHILGVSC